MKIIIDTTKRMVKESKPKKADKALEDTETEVRIANLLAITIAGQAIKHYKSHEVRERYIDEVARSARNMLRKMEEEHEQNN